MLGSMVALGAALMATLAITYMRRLAQNIERAEAVPLYYCLGSAVFMPV